MALGRITLYLYEKSGRGWIRESVFEALAAGTSRHFPRQDCGLCSELAVKRHGRRENKPLAIHPRQSDGEICPGMSRRALPLEQQLIRHPPLVIERFERLSISPVKMQPELHRIWYRNSKLSKCGSVSAVSLNRLRTSRDINDAFPEHEVAVRLVGKQWSIEATSFKVIMRHLAQSC